MYIRTHVLLVITSAAKPFPHRCHRAPWGPARSAGPHGYSDPACKGSVDDEEKVKGGRTKEEGGTRVMGI
jgi:hypothetical protein